MEIVEDESEQLVDMVDLYNKMMNIEMPLAERLKHVHKFDVVLGPVNFVGTSIFIFLFVRLSKNSPNKNRLIQIVQTKFKFNDLVWLSFDILKIELFQFDFGFYLQTDRYIRIEPNI